MNYVVLVMCGKNQLSVHLLDQICVSLVKHSFLMLDFSFITHNKKVCVP